MSLSVSVLMRLVHIVLNAQEFHSCGERILQDAGDEIVAAPTLAIGQAVEDVLRKTSADNSCRALESGYLSF
jgi:hypothetical protein